MVFGNDKKEDTKQNVTYLVGDFSKVTVSIANGFLGMMKTIEPRDLQKPVHDENIGNQTYRLWNADPKFYGELAKRLNTVVFGGDLAGQKIEIHKDGITASPMELER